MADMIEWSMLKNVLIDDENGLRIVGRHLIPENDLPSREMPQLRDDFLSAEEAELTRQHNLRWAVGREKAPRLLLTWLMLPTRCNQRCAGCYASNDKQEKETNHGEFYSMERLNEVLRTLKSFGVRTIGYAGLGELFIMRKPDYPMDFMEYIRLVVNHGFKLVIFTNGTLLTSKILNELYQLPVSLIFSLRDTLEFEHNKIVRINGFRKSLESLDYALKLGLQKQNRLGVEIPVIRSNVERVLFDFIPAMRHLGIIPYAEQYMQVATSPEEKKMGLSFAEARDFFQRAQKVEKRFGYIHEPCYAQRMVSQGPCLRPIFSVTIYPDGRVTPCPGNSTAIGNIFQTPLEQVLVSKRYKEWVKDFQMCACSVFYTDNDHELPVALPPYLEVFK